MLHSSFAAWVQSEVVAKASTHVRLDGLPGGGNRDIFGRFKHAGRKWEVHGDTRIERVLRAYAAIQNRTMSDPFVIERATVRDCLNLIKALRKPKEPKHFYVYETL